MNKSMPLSAAIAIAKAASNPTREVTLNFEGLNVRWDGLHTITFDAPLTDQMESKTASESLSTWAETTTLKPAEVQQVFDYINHLHSIDAISELLKARITPF